MGPGGQENDVDGNNKSVAARLGECVNIRQQLQMLGALLNDDNSARISTAMNAYVRDASAPGESVDIVLDKGSLSRPTETVLKIQLSSKAHHKSGITLVQ